MGLITWATQSVGKGGSDPYCVVPDLGLRDCRIALHDRACALRGDFCRAEEVCEATIRPAVVAAVPERVPRHSLVARAFHWVMAISMFALLITAFLPKVGVKFDWVTYHWIAGSGADRIRPVSHRSRIVLSGFLVDMAGQDRHARCEEKVAARAWARTRRRRTGLRSIRWKTSFIMR